jgi:hypothetical protein
MNLTNFLAELKRRNVYKVAVACTVGRLAAGSNCDAGRNLFVELKPQTSS